MASIMNQTIIKPIAVVLGGTNPHVALIEGLRKRGYYVVLVDYLEKPPASEFADLHLRESTLDKDKVYEICLQLRAALVISVAVDQANAVACYVAEKLGLKKPYSYSTALDVSDKSRMKDVMSKHGIPTARYMNLSSDEIDRVGELGFPIVIKPADGTGSKGVRRADCLDDAKSSFAEALGLSRNGIVVVEEYIDGWEASVDCVVRNGKSEVVLIRRKYGVRGGGDNPVLQCLVSLCPTPVELELKRRIDQVAAAVVKAFDLKNTSLLLQVFVSGNEVNVIEFAPRIGGGLSFRTVLLSSGCDILDYTINSFLGEEESAVAKPSDSYFLTVNLYAYPCDYSHVLGVKALLQADTIKEFYNYKSEGAVITGDMSARNRIGAFIIEGKTVEAVISKMKAAIEEIKVVDASGCDQSMRSIYANIDF
jgi:biotin carboxylase